MLDFLVALYCTVAVRTDPIDLYEKQLQSECAHRILAFLALGVICLEFLLPYMHTSLLTGEPKVGAQPKGAPPSGPGRTLGNRHKDGSYSACNLKTILNPFQHPFVSAMHPFWRTPSSLPQP